jgi:hypothetical protein
MISGCRREVEKNSTLLGYYATIIGHFLLTFRDNLLVPFLRVSIFYSGLLRDD